MADPGPETYLIFLEPDPGQPLGAGRSIALGSGLYLCASPVTRSRLYHALKAAHHPVRLLVAPLAGDPKFKGMAQGALKALRRRSRLRRPEVSLSPAASPGPDQIRPTSPGRDPSST